MTPEEFNAWMEHPVTETFFRWADRQREVLKEQWATAAFMSSSIEETAIKNSGAVGAASVWDMVLELECDQLNEVENEPGNE